MNAFRIWFVPTLFEAQQLCSKSIRCASTTFCSPNSSNHESSFNLGNCLWIILIPRSDSCLKDVACLFDDTALASLTLVAWSWRIGGSCPDLMRKSLDCKPSAESTTTLLHHEGHECVQVHCKRHSQLGCCHARNLGHQLLHA